ncbi:MAG: hypothetical protein IJK84_07875 [Bacteroidales bacterium]|nr:hypothetical protein [Bacteroidales bacterium]
MNPVEKIRDQHRTALLQQLAAKPHRTRIIHLHDIRTIGIITPQLNDEDQITIAQFMHHMTENGSMVRKIEMPLNIEQQLDKYGLPKADLTQLFTSYHYDLLIDSTPSDSLFGLYVTLAASSNLRVGYQDTTLPTQDYPYSTYDLIILGKGPIVLSQYLPNLLSILMQIRKTPSK